MKTGEIRRMDLQRTRLLAAAKQLLQEPKSREPEPEQLSKNSQQASLPEESERVRLQLAKHESGKMAKHQERAKQHAYAGACCARGTQRAAGGEA